MGNKTLDTDFQSGCGSSLSTVTEWLSKGFKQYNTSTALQWRTGSLTYHQLDTFSNRIANFLVGRGVKKGDRVGICLNRSPELIATIIGILKIGAAYVPLDPDYPLRRLEMMTEDAQTTLLICHKKYKERFASNANAIAVWEKNADVIKRYSDIPLNVDIDGTDVAYVIFTSGSTGRPKGIVMPHRALANLIDWQLQRPYFLNERNVLQYSSISFDVSFQEIATTLASGGCLFLLENEERRDPRLLLKFLQEYKIERLFIPFVALRSLVEVAVYTKTSPQSLREVITAGEQLRVDADLQSFFVKLPGSVLENQYGPSETHVISAYLLPDNPLEWNELPPIGKSLAHNDIYILDKNMKPVVLGEIGELYLAGINLAHGYLGPDDLTRKAFIKNPLKNSNHPILYKTGDLGFFNSDGDIEFLGRVDHQIKVHGYRIEREEINAAGAKYPGVSQCLTHTIQDAAGRTQLVTYFKAEEEAEVRPDQFKTFLAQTLPEYMTPTFVMKLSDIPYTPSGKVDLKSLPKPNEQLEVEASKTKISFHNETEEKLAKIWCEILKLSSISRNASFFDVGGDSLNAVTLFMEIEKQFNKYLPLSSLVQAPTVKSLAKLINGNYAASDHLQYRSLQVIQPGNGKLIPLFMVHGGAGNVLMFKDLADGLPPDQPVYAFQWSGWDGYRGEEDIMDMARFYKDELRKVRPQGPYRLGGHCVGGIIAIEIAKLLKAEGAEVIDPLLVSDAPNLHAKCYFADEPEATVKSKEVFDQTMVKLNLKIAEHLNSTTDDIENEPVQMVVNPNDHTIRRYPALAKYLPFYVSLAKGILKAQYRMQLMRIFIRKTMGLKISANDRERYSVSAQLKAIKKHKKTVYNGDILYFKSQELYGRKLALQGWWDDIFFGFEELCTGHFESYVVGGGHNEVLKKKSVQKIIRERMFGIDE